MPSPASKLERLEKRLAQLSVEELKALQASIADLIAEKEELEAGSQRSGRQMVKRRYVGRVTYQLEKVKCGKPACRCAQENGELHGPYWYLYRWNGKKVVSEYVGKKLPDDIQRELRDAETMEPDDPEPPSEHLNPAR